VFFALELILRTFDTESFGFVVLSSVTADAIGRAAFGSHPFLTLPGFNFTSPLELVLIAGLGVLAVGVGLTFVRSLYAGEDLADRLRRGPSWLRPAAGGILLGLLLLAVPQMYGVGYPVLLSAVAGHYVTLALLGLPAAKILATSAEQRNHIAARFVAERADSLPLIADDGSRTVACSAPISNARTIRSGQ
jgi:CIC family chloride channel protein